MKQIKVKNWTDIPSSFTGIAEWPSGTKQWFLNARYHRVDGPASERADGEKHWFLNGSRHRVDGPATEHTDGTKEWFLNGNQHRENGPAVELADGRKSWYLNGKYLFELEPESQPFVFIEETEDKQQIKVLTPKGTEFWKNVPGLKELAENYQKPHKSKT